MRNHIPGEEIRAARMAAGFTRNQLGAAIGCSPGAISHWENNKNGIQNSHYRKLVRLLDLGPKEQRPTEEETTSENESLLGGFEVELNKTLLLDIPDYLFEALVEAADREFRTVENQVLWYLQCCLEGGEE